MNNIIAVIPARGGSKGVPRKNIKELCNIPLIEFSINTARQAFNNCFVSTEDDEIASIASKLGANIIDRPIEYATDESTDYEWLKHAFEVLNCENIAILRPTTPTRCLNTMYEGIKLFESNPNCSSMRSAHEAPETPYKWFEKAYKDDKYWKKNPLSDLPRQTLPKVFIPNGYLDIVRKETVLSSKNNDAFGDKILAFITEPIIELDTIESFKCLESILKGKS